ncbi:MAG: ABC transporter permease [Planctomycetota bacterium]
MPTDDSEVQPPEDRDRLPRLTAGRFGTTLFLIIALPCFLSLFWTLGAPPNQGKGQHYNDLRYDTKVIQDGQEVEIEIQEQAPGRVQYTRTITPKEGEPVEIKTFAAFEPMGTDQQGRSLFIRCLLGGAISLGVGVCAALMAVFIGVTWGATAGYIGGRVDSFMMRVVDVLYGLPYLLLVVLLSVAVGGITDNLSDGFVRIPGWAAWLWDLSGFVYWLVVIFCSLILLTLSAGLFWVSGLLIRHFTGLLDLMGFTIRLLTFLFATTTVFLATWAIVIGLLMPFATSNGLPVPVWITDILVGYPLVVNLLTLVVAIGGVSWLTMARVIRGQVLSLRTEPFIEAARAQGMNAARIMRVHLLPNLIGPIVVYTTLAVPQAILQESFLSFLGIGVTPPLPSWGQLASEGIKELPALAVPQLADEFKWWVLVFPCLLLGMTLLSLNFMGDAMRERFDPRSKKRGA